MLLTRGSLAPLQKRRRRCPHELRTSSSLHAPPHEPSSVTRPVQMRPFASEVVVSKDGTTIGYRRLGAGPGLVLVHGGMQAAQDLMALASLLSDEFTVFVPDRRGRGASGPFGDPYGLQQEIEDLGVLLRKTGARHVFGLSVGGLIALGAA